ncbi:MAG: GEVED domain-containing protein, partial [Flavipsychrobacter sp.]
MNRHLQFILITFFLLFGSSASFGQNYVNSSFDATTFPPTGWTSNVISGSGSLAASFNWIRTTSGISYPTGVTPHSGAAMAGYNSYWISSGGSAELVTPSMNFSTYTGGSNQMSFWFYYTGASDRVQVYINTSASSSGGTLLGTVYGYSPGASGWKQYTYTLPASYSSSSSVYIIFKSVSAYGDDLLIDDVSVDHIPACSGAASVSVSSVSRVCSGNSFTLTATTTPALISGVAFQWQSSSSATGPWTTIAGATNTTYTTSITGTTYFRCVDTCRSVGAISISNVDTVSLNVAALCPCNPAYYYSTYYGIAACSYNINSFSCTGTPPSTLSDGFLSCGSSGSPSFSGYYDRTFDTVKLTQGGTYSGGITFSYGYYSGYGIWIDFNDDGVFSSTELLVFNQRGSGGGLPTSYSMSIPFSVATGPHRMRVRYVYTGSSLSATQSFRNTIDPCALSVSSPTCCDYYYEGAARDYVVNILPAPACSGMPAASVTPTGPQTLCSGVADTLTAALSTPVTGLTYQWQSSNTGGVSWTNISGATNRSYIFTVSSTLWYRCVVTCSNSGLSANSNIVIVNLKAVCPCTPTYYYGSPSSSYNMYHVTINGYSGSSISDNPPTSSPTGYTDRTAVVAALNVLQGGSYTGTLSFHYYYQSAAVWIDFNDDGTFSSSELMAGPTTSTSCCSYITNRNITINIPATAATGLHLMRIRDVYTCCSTPAAIDPCTVGSTYYYGNTADYLVNVQGVVPTPTLSATSQNLCSGNTISITASTTDTGTLTYNWTGPNGFVSSTSTTATSNTVNITGAAFANSGVYTVRVTSAGGTSSPAFDTVSVWPYPVFVSGNPSNNSPVCTPNPLMLSGYADPANATWSWTGPSAFTSSLVNPVISPTSASNSGTYTLAVSNHGCTTTANTTATVYQTPSIASVTGNNPTSCTCNCGSFVLSGLNASTAYTVAYQKNGIAITPVSKTTDASGNLTVSGLSAAIYSSITVTLNACPSAPVSVTLINPTAPATPVASSNSPVCQGSTLSFSATDATAGVSWTWLGPNSFSSSVSSPSRANAPFADSGTYYVFVTDGSGCTSNVVTLNVAVKPIPVNPTASSNAPVCQGTTLVLNANDTTTGATYSWTGPGFPTGSTLQNPTISSVPSTASGIYTVYAVLNGCQSALPATVNVYVKWTPGTPTLTTNSPICNGMGYNPNVLTMNVSDTSMGITYTWSGPNAFSIYNDSSTSQSITNPPFLDSGIYTVYATLNGCNSASASARVIIKPTPPRPAVSPTFAMYCQYDNAIALSATGTAIRWYAAPTGGTSTTPPFIPQDSIAGLFVYYATQTIGGCESQPTSDTVLVKTKPLPPAAPATYTYCQGDNASPIAAIGVNLLWYTSSTGGTGSPVTPTPSTATPG